MENGMTMVAYTSCCDSMGEIGSFVRSIDTAKAEAAQRINALLNNETIDPVAALKEIDRIVTDLADAGVEYGTDVASDSYYD